jgi:acetyltransferase-like isoleucine patch superfamily enzyme
MNIAQRLLFKLGSLIRDAERAWTLSTLRSCGSSARIDQRVFIWGADRLDVGNKVDINGYTVIYAAGGVRIHDNVLIGANCVITSVSHPVSATERHQLVFAPVELLDNCWLGAGTMVMPGITIGRNSIVAAGSVVTKNIPDNCICAGIPAKITRYLDSSNEQD